MVWNGPKLGIFLNSGEMVIKFVKNGQNGQNGKKWFKMVKIGHNDLKWQAWPWVRPTYRPKRPKTEKDVVKRPPTGSQGPKGLHTSLSLNSWIKFWQLNSQTIRTFSALTHNCVRYFIKITKVLGKSLLKQSASFFGGRGSAWSQFPSSEPQI